MANVHPTAIVAHGASIDETCSIGPYCIIGKDVKLAKNVVLMGHVFIDGDTFIDEGTVVFPFATIGVIPQDLKYKGEKTKVIIGKNNKIREHATIHLATEDGIGITQVGDGCLLMVNSHVAHDVIVGNGVIVGNNVMLAGHVTLEDGVIISGGSAVHQFCRIGEHAFIGGMSGVTADIVPFALYTGTRDTAEINGVNLVGLKRKGYSSEDIQAIRSCYDLIFSDRLKFKESLMKANELYNNNEKVMKVLSFVTSAKSRGLCHSYRNSNSTK